MRRGRRVNCMEVRKYPGNPPRLAGLFPSSPRNFLYICAPFRGKADSVAQLDRASHYGCEGWGSNPSRVATTKPPPQRRGGSFRLAEGESGAGWPRSPQFSWPRRRNPGQLQGFGIRRLGVLGRSILRRKSPMLSWALATSGGNRTCIGSTSRLASDRHGHLEVAHKVVRPPVVGQRSTARGRGWPIQILRDVRQPRIDAGEVQAPWPGRDGVSPGLHGRSEGTGDRHRWPGSHRRTDPRRGRRPSRRHHLQRGRPC